MIIPFTVYALTGLVTGGLVIGAYFSFLINPHALTWLVPAVVNVYVAAFVFLKDPSRRLNRMFALLSLCFSGLLLNAFELYLVPDARWAMSISNIVSPGMILLPAVFFAFTVSLTGRNERFLRVLQRLAFALALSFLAMRFGGFLVRDYVWTGWKFAPVPTALYKLCLANGYAWLLGGLAHVFLSYRQARSAKLRAQLKYFFLASLIGGLFTFQNALISFGLRVYPMGGVSATVYLSIIAYSIIKHQLMDINVIIRRSLVYATLTLSVAGIYSIVVGGIVSVLDLGSRLSSTLFVNGLAGAIIAAVFLPLRNRIQLAVDRLFYKEKYNYQQTLKDFSGELTALFEPDLLAERLITTITETMHIECGCILLWNAERDRFETRFNRGLSGGVVLERKDNLVQWLEKNRSVFVNGDAPFAVPALDKLRIDLCVPMILRDRLIGMLCLGGKMSEDMYSDADCKLLTTLANQAAIAVENAELSLKMRALEKSLYHADKLSALGTFASSVAHEIKNPLASIKTFCQLVARRFDDARFVEKFNGIVPAEIERLEGVLGQMLDFGRFSGGELAPVKVEKVIDDLITLVHYETFKGNVKVLRKYAENTPPIMASEEQMKQVFMNLMINAMQAMPDGGEIAIATEVQPKAGKGGTVCVAISDSGCGIPEESLERLFKPFFTTKANGTGLGLSITRKIIKEHGGTIEVTSEINKGTTFLIKLPFSKPA